MSSPQQPPPGELGGGADAGAPVAGASAEPQQPEAAATAAPSASDTEVDAPAVDFTVEESKTEPSHSREQIELLDYDSRPHEDNARRFIAYSLIAILGVVIFWMMLLVHCDVISVEDLKEFTVILGPLVTLVSAATGFYYGTKSGGGPGGKR